MFLVLRANSLEFHHYVKPHKIPKDIVEEYIRKKYGKMNGLDKVTSLCSCIHSKFRFGLKHLYHSIQYLQSLKSG